MEPNGKKQRVFVALDLPDQVREGIAAWGRVELIDPALRPTRPESLHVTLVFLGARAAAEVEEIAAVVRRSGVPAPLMQLEDPISLPRGRRAALFALPAPSAAASSLRRALVGPFGHRGPVRARGAPFLAPCDGRQGAGGRARIAPSGSGHEAARRPAGGTQTCVRVCPTCSLPF